LAELLAGEGLASGQIDQMTISLRADLLRAGGIEARSVFLDGGLENGELQLSSFSVADLAGARLEARGSIQQPFDQPSGSISGPLKPTTLRGRRHSFRVSAGNELVAHLKQLAPTLSPAGRTYRPRLAPRASRPRSI
jgi:hypothetical protein